MKKFLLSASLLCLVVTGCKKDYLYKAPIDEVTEQTAFKTYDNFKTYTWKLYDYMIGYGSAGSVPPSMVDQDVNADNIVRVTSGAQSVYSTGAYVTPPATAGNGGSSLQIAGWDFTYIYSVNVMLDNVGQSSMTPTQKDHWTSVGYFFRALRYYDLIAAFGDVPWLEHTLTDTSTSELYAPRTSRDTVAQNILNNLEWAESHINVDGNEAVDGVNTINKSCVQALISRFGLFEGTWRKYHSLSNANTYLQACVTYSQKLMASHPTLLASYDDVFNSEDLTGKAGIILFKQYVANAQITSASGSNSNPNDLVSRYVGSTSWPYDVPKSAIESYLCTDGRPIGSSTVYQGDDSMYSAFMNRDRRLYFTVIPPYEIKFKNLAKTSVSGASDTLWTYDGNAMHRYFIDLMKALPGNTNKAIPLQAQSSDMQSGNIIPNIPHFKAYPDVISALPTLKSIPQMAGVLGYYFWKFYNRLPQDNSGTNTNDCPLFRMGEVLVNDAEAQYELGTFDQSVADATINKLRVRANVASMVVANINAAFDPSRDPTVDPVLWEIRRERRVELFGDGFRFNDLKRWAKGTYLNNYPLGVKVNNATYGNKLTIDGGSSVGYVKFFNAANGWTDKYYLEPLPLQELSINKALEQNPGWPKN